MALIKKPKKASKDFQKSMLPQTRRAVFFDVLKLQWSKLLRLSLVLLAAAIPLLVISLYEDSYILTVLENANTSDTAALLAPLHIYCAILSAPCLVLFFLGLSGVIRVVRQLAWEENAMVFPDFLVGIRQNWKPFIPTGMLFGIFYALAKIGWHSALVSQTQSVWVQGIALGLLIFLIAPLVACCTVVIAIYSNSFWGNLRLALFVYLKNPLKTVGATLLAFGPSAVIWVLPQLELHLIGAIPAMMVFTLGLLGWMLFIFHQLDQHYNAQHYPELVGKGVGGQ